MTLARFQTIEQIFLAALEQEADQVSAFLDTASKIIQNQQADSLVGRTTLRNFWAIAARRHVLSRQVIARSVYESLPVPVDFFAPSRDRRPIDTVDASGVLTSSARRESS